MKTFNVEGQEAEVNFIARGGLFNPVLSYKGTHKDIPLLLDEDEISRMSELMGQLKNNYENLEILRLTVAGAARIAMRD